MKKKKENRCNDIGYFPVWHEEEKLDLPDDLLGSVSGGINQWIIDNVLE